MKLVKRMSAVALAGVMMFSLVACKKSSKVTADDFKKACDKAGLTYQEAEADEETKVSIEASNEDDTISVAFIQMKDADTAKEGFEMLKAFGGIPEEDQAKEAGIDLTASDNKIEASDDSHYMLLKREGDVIITMMAEGEDQVSKGKDFVKDLGL